MAGDVHNYGIRQALLKHARYPRIPQIVNLNCVAMIEDLTDENGSKAVITTSDGAEIELVGTDADILFQRAELLMEATDKVISQLQNAG
jgi:hypothetical protein